MLFMKYFLTTVGFGLLMGAAGILIYDLYQVFKMRGTSRKPQLSLAAHDPVPEPEPAGERPALVPRWRKAGQIAAIGLLPLLLGMSIQVVPAGSAGVVVSQFWGTLPGTLYAGVHWIFP